MTDGGASILSDVKSSLSAAVASGEFLQRIIEEAAAAGGSAAMAFMTIDLDVTASTAAIGDATLTLAVPTPSPVDEDEDYENACREWGYPKEGEWNVDEDCCAGKKQMACADGYRLENTGNVCYEDDCTTAYNYHCIACDPASACMGDLDEDGEDYGCDEDDEDDDDDDGGTELVMSGGLVAIGLTFTGISIAAIANAVQEQCALGPTIVYEAGTTHPYYISPNLCSIGTKTYASKTTVRDASPRKVCRKFCEAASEKGILALKHVQGLTCYCKRK